MALDRLVEPDEPVSSSLASPSVCRTSPARKGRSGDARRNGTQKRGSRPSPGEKAIMRHTLQNFSKYILAPDQNARVANSLKYASAEQIENCYISVKDDLVALSKHPSANYAIQMLFKVASGKLLDSPARRVQAALGAAARNEERSRREVS